MGVSDSLLPGALLLLSDVPVSSYHMHPKLLYTVAYLTYHLSALGHPEYPASSHSRTHTLGVALSQFQFPTLTEAIP